MMLDIVDELAVERTEEQRSLSTTFCSTACENESILSYACLGRRPAHSC